MRRNKLFVLLLFATSAWFIPRTAFAQDYTIHRKDLQEEFFTLNNRYSQQDLDSLLMDLRKFDQKIELEKPSMSEFEYGYFAANTALTTGHVFNSLALTDSAVVYFYKSADLFAKYTEYNGYFIAMANALQPILVREEFDEYLEQLEFHYRKSIEVDPDLEDLFKAVYLRFRLFALQDETEKMKVIDELDYIFDNNLYDVKGLLQFRFYTDVLEYAYEYNKQELITRFLPKYEAEVVYRGINKGGELWWRARFDLRAKNTKDAILHFEQAIQEGLSKTLEEGAHKELYLLYKEAQQYDSALASFEQYKIMQEEVDFNRVKIITEDLIAKSQLNVAKANLSIEKSKNQSLKMQGYAASAGILLLLLSSTLLFILAKQRKINFRNLEALKKAELQVVESEVEKLKSTLIAKFALREQSLLNGHTYQQPITKDGREPTNGHPEADILEEINLNLIKFLRGIPGLTTRDYKLATFIMAGYDNSDLEQIFGISAHSVRIAKSRLKGKLGLGKEDDLTQWLRDNA